MKLRNTLIAVAAGLALVAGHASAANAVVDRVGVEDEGMSSLTLVGLAGGILATVLINGSRADEAESD
jgi:hypothetical protein